LRLASKEPTLNGHKYLHPDYECDLIMKGGITSGIVYPPAVLELAKSHRFRRCLLNYAPLSFSIGAGAGAIFLVDLVYVTARPGEPLAKHLDQGCQATGSVS
jgi:hypothetical protein